MPLAAKDMGKFFRKALFTMSFSVSTTNSAPTVNAKGIAVSNKPATPSEGEEVQGFWSRISAAMEGSESGETKDVSSGESSDVMLTINDDDSSDSEKVILDSDDMMATDGVKKMTSEELDDTDVIVKGVSQGTDSDHKPAENSVPADEVVAEGAVLLGRLDESNKTLQKSASSQGDSKEQQLASNETVEQKSVSSAEGTTAILAGSKIESEQQTIEPTSPAVLSEDTPLSKELSSDSKLANGKLIPDFEKVSKGNANSNQIVWSKEGQGNDTKGMAVATMMAPVSEGEKTTQMLNGFHSSSAQLNSAVGMQQVLTASPAATSAADSSQQAAMIAGLGVTTGAKGLEKRPLGNEVTENGLAPTTSLNSTTAMNQLRADQPTANAQSPLVLTKENAGEQVAERLQMMMSKNLKHVDIRLDPPELGRMQIRMSLNSDAASVHFTVQNQQTRDLVDQAMPRLREMLAQQGLQLADSSVQQQSSGQQQMAQHQGSDNGSSQLASGEHDAESMEGATSIEMNVTEKSDGISLYA